MTPKKNTPITYESINDWFNKTQKPYYSLTFEEGQKLKNEREALKASHKEILEIAKEVVKILTNSNFLPRPAEILICSSKLEAALFNAQKVDE